MKNNPLGPAVAGLMVGAVSIGIISYSIYIQNKSSQSDKMESNESREPELKNENNTQQENDLEASEPEPAYERQKADSGELTAQFPNPCTHLSGTQEGVACMGKTGFIIAGQNYIKYESNDPNGVEFQWAKSSGSNIYGKYMDCKNGILYNRTHNGSIGGGLPQNSNGLGTYVCKMYF